MSPGIVAAASDFMMIANLARIYIWWQAVRQPKALRPGDASPK
jgi:hypothetical protein